MNLSSGLIRDGRSLILNSKIPKNWCHTTTKNACSIVVDCHNKTAPYTDSGIKLVRTSNIRDGKIDLRDVKYINQETYEYWSRRCIPQSGDILFTREAPMGEVGIIPPGEKICMGQRMMLLRADGKNLLNKYLLYALQSPFNHSYIEQNSIGTGVKHLRVRDVENLPIRIAPIAEQQRIVDKIEELFSDLDSGINSLKTAQQQLKVYRQAVLKWAFEGKLTAQWREEQQRQGQLASADTLLTQIKAEREQRYQKELEAWQSEVEAWEAIGKEGKKPRKPKKLKTFPPLTEDDLQEFAPLPKLWPWVRLGEIIEEPKYGTSKKCNYDFEGKAVLRIPNIGDGVVNRDDLKFAGFDQDELQTYQLIRGDLLTIRSNGSVSLVGKCALISERDENFLYAGYLIRLRPYSNILNSRFLIYCMSSVLLRNQIESKAKSTSGVNNINSGELQDLKISYCSLAEQEQVVEEIESRLSICDQLEADIEANLKKAEALRQSILKQAFEGKLVPQDPNDEPAAVLLEKIRSDREKAKQAKLNQIRRMNLSKFN